MSDDDPRMRAAGTVRANRSTAVAVVRQLWPWVMVAVILAIGYSYLSKYLDNERGAEEIKWLARKAWWLALGGLFVGVIGFQLHRRWRSAAMGFSQVGLVGARGFFAWLSDVPTVLRVVAIVSLSVALARPETYRTVIHQEDSIDIMIVVDMSKSMEEMDIPRDRLDAAQRVIRRFLRRTKHDRVGLVIFGQQAMVQSPLTSNMRDLEQTVANLAIGDVPELGTAIGDGLAMAIASLRRSDGSCNPPPATDTCPEQAKKDGRDPDEFACNAKGFCEAKTKKRHKVVILLSDGDNNWVTRFNPEEAARTAAAQDVKVYTVLVGREESDVFGGMSVNPATLRNIAEITGGEFFRASDYESFDRGFQSVRKDLDTIKKERRERLPDKQLFVIFALLGAIAIALEILLSHTRLRRLP
jgi:Ca-activated chloride channel homolog